ncbi:OmpA family protein [Sulfitobacter albidus]|uniref:OmpA family protein n=1 Tax=Sulfitobacter albidus TaxID=2829501 RepID=A0A975JCE8_9RHOB|nr:OmpA family protein [Sulfitobacter albidus]QUJ75907.1 OmpA family protein [Sulfitobacter albidus]
MTFSKFSLAAALAGVFALGACTNPNGSILAQDGDPNQNAKNGALIGAASGAVIGALSRGDGNRDQGALKGAIIGGALGAGGGVLLDRQEAELRRQLDSRVVIQNTGDRLIVTLPQDITFDSGSSAVSAGIQGDLQALAQNVQVYQNSTLQIIGHTDSDGDAAFNQQLSEDRARAVANVLTGNGVPGARIQTFGRGEAQPVASNLTPEGKRQNRRVEIVILPNPA